MKTIITTLSLFLVGMLANAQTENRTVSSFSKIEVGGNIELVFTETIAPSIQVNAPDSNIITQINDGILKISLKNKSTETMKVYVTGNGLNSIKAESEAKVTVKNQLSAPEFNLALLSGSSFHGLIKSPQKMTMRLDENALFVGRIETEMLIAKFGSNAKAAISGSATVANINTGGRALCHAGNLSSENISVSADNFSTVKLYAKKTIDIIVSENGKVTYSGTPMKVNLNENAMAFGSKSGMPIASN